MKAAVLLAGNRAGTPGAGSHKPVPAGSAFERLIKYFGLNDAELSRILGACSKSYPNF
jgi:hypothetical protein